MSQIWFSLEQISPSHQISNGKSFKSEDPLMGFQARLNLCMGSQMFKWGYKHGCGGRGGYGLTCPTAIYLREKLNAE